MNEKVSFAMVGTGANKGGNDSISVEDSLDAMLDDAEYDALIGQATSALAENSLPTDAAIFHFYRGVAYWRLGFLDEADADLSAISPADARIIPSLLGPQWYRDTIARQKEQRPAHRLDIRVGGRLLFVMYFDTDNETVRALTPLLPVAANSVQRFTNAPPRPTVVLVFDDMERMQAYEGIPGHSAPIDYTVLARGGMSGVHIAPLTLPNGARTNPRGGYFRLTVTHEYMHVIVARLLEDSDPLPVWLSEGIANVAGTYSAPAESADFATRFRLVVAKNAVLPLDTLSRTGEFDRIAASHAAEQTASDPYAQATLMTEYLLLGRPPTIFADLLSRLRKTDDFDDAFAQTFGETPDAFYEEWRAYALR